jgi:O-antigen/teichoic acid export membrane protein
MSEDSVAARTVRGSAYSTGASVVTLGLGFVRSVLLARLLAQEDFGVVALALFFLSITNQLGGFGLTSALIHRTEDLEEAVPTHFFLSIGFGILTFALVILASPILLHFYSEQPQMVWALLGFSAVDLFRAVNATPQAVLYKELEFGYIATVDVVSAVLMTIVAPLAAWAGLGFWSLVVERAVGVITRSTMLWVIRRPWRPRWHFSTSMARWFLRFGGFVFASRGLTFLLDQFDDFWTGTVLGPTQLGYYSRAYEFARYPRRVVANPVMTVFFPTFAKLQHNRLKLSQAFYRVISLIVRVGFLFAGAFMLVAPEFIRIFLGERWMPMVFTFRLMLIYTLLDPILNAAGQLTVAVGAPQARTWTKLAQLVFFVPAVIVGARAWGIDGVAVAADLMLLVGMVGLFPQLRKWVDFSARRMLGFPLLGLALGLAAGFLVEQRLAPSSDWISLLIKAVAFTLLYVAVMLLFERKEYRRNLQLLLEVIQSSRRRQVSALDGSL